jgi:hypothetical protein
MRIIFVLAGGVEEHHHQCPHPMEDMLPVDPDAEDM